MGWRNVIQSSLRRIGYEVVRYPLHSYLKTSGITVVLDIGANNGQYATELRENGYSGRIVSFEPFSSAFEQLEAASAADPGWLAVRLALGDAQTDSVLHVAGNTASSSILGMLQTHLDVAPESATIGDETVPVARLDAVYSDYVPPDSRVFVKIDTQGYEERVLKGAEGVMDQIIGLQMEMSLEPLYEGEALADELMGRTRRAGFAPVWITHGLKDPATLRLLQLDGIFFRPDELKHRTNG